MISLLQQTAPAAVETTTTTVTVQPADMAAPVTVTESPAVTVTPAAPIDSVVVIGDPAHAGTDATHAVAGAQDAAASAGMPQLDFATFGNQIFWLLIALAAIYLILSRVALPRIARILADRQGLMTSDLAAAEDFKRKARDAEAAYDKALADARSEAGKIVAANKAEIDAELKAAIAKADAEISARTVESERRIGEIRQSAATDARHVAQDVAEELVRAFGASPDSAAVQAAVDARLKGAA